MFVNANVSQLLIFTCPVRFHQPARVLRGPTAHTRLLVISMSTFSVGVNVLHELFSAICKLRE